MKEVGRDVTGTSGWELWVNYSQERVSGVWTSIPNELSLMVRLPSATGTFPLYCINTAGKASKVTGSCVVSGLGTGYQYCPGCYRSPL
ncbi:MAG: hypothetical protein EOM19_00515 [Candidatus Moranbacteria bacterium]|nr:hypothetical protein [Candidatus Moranbacteria bacterium]